MRSCLFVLVALLAAVGMCAGATFKVLYAFQGAPDGSNPESAVVFDSQGNLYGTTYSGGTGGCLGGCGTVYQLTPNGSGGFTERVIYSFQGPLIDGDNPQAPLIFDAQGNLYGTTYMGGQSVSAAAGTVFKLSRNANGSWKETVLHNFNGALLGGHDGGGLLGGLVFDAAGNLYGTTVGGGTGSGCAGGLTSGCGIVFALTPAANGAWHETILHNFTNDHHDGWSPQSTLVLDAAGSLYGTTFLGGSETNGSGTVFKLTRKASGFQESILHSFQCGTDGCSPYSGVIFDASGDLYGTTVGGGDSQGQGTVFKLTPASGGGWTESVIHTFTGGKDGIFPYGNPVLDAAGNLFGTTFDGGGGQNSGCTDGCGTVWKLVPGAGGIFAETIMSRFGNGRMANGSLAGLVMDAQGNLYGTAAFGGPHGHGVVFEITP